MTSIEIRKRFIAFFQKRGHAVLPSASLVPENDPSVLFTTAGMHPLVPYLMGEAHPQGTRLVNVQKCIRTQDIEEVGDKTHDTFFEMLGNWSLGDYFKKEAITWSYQFLTDTNEGLGLDPKRLYITCFAGDDDAPRDNESAGLWQELGIPKNRIYYLGKEHNWWSPGDNGPCGPDTEMYYDVTKNRLGDLSHEQFLEADTNETIVELWNDVFMEYEKKNGMIIGKLVKKNVDTGAGLERLSMVMQKKDNIFETDLFSNLMQKIDSVSKKIDIQTKRIIADHIRTAVFILSDGIIPSNTDQGYVLRRLIRRAVRKANELEMTEESLSNLADVVIDTYKTVYKNIGIESHNIKAEIVGEVKKFKKTLIKGLEELNKLIRIGGIEKISPGKEPKIFNRVDAKKAFFIYQTFGFPFEMIQEDLAKRGLIIDEDEFKDEFKKEQEIHQKISRKGVMQKFAGGLADHHETTVKMHTATHLLQAALREVLGTHVLQRGSNITRERLRFDFSHLQKMTAEEVRKVEDRVNANIKRGLTMKKEVVTAEEAKKSNTIGLFQDKYAQIGDRLSVYSAIDPLTNKIVSREICGGPHVENTSELGNFKIIKEESASAGVRRIKAIVH